MTIMEDLFRLNPFLLLLCGLLGGIGLSYIGAPWWTAALLFLLASCLYLWLSILSGSVEGSIKSAPWHYAWIFIGAIALGIFTMNFHTPFDYEKESDRLPPLAKAMVKEASQGTVNARMTLDITDFLDTKGNSIIKPRNLLVSAYGEEYFHPGTTIVFLHDLQPEDADEGNDQNSSYPAYLKSQGIYYTQYLPKHQVFMTDYKKGLKEFAYGLRENLLIKLEKSNLGKSATAFVCALMLGDRNSISPEEMQSFRLSGLSHLLALSGLHVGILAMILSWLLLPLSAFGQQRPRWMIVIVLLWCYALLTGLSVSAVRACVMVTFCLGALALERKNSSINALMAAAFFILLFDPLQLTSPGFQLSFVAAGLLILTADVNPIERHKHPWTYKIIQALTVSVTTMAGTAALAAYHFHTLPLASLLPNLLCTTLMPLYLSVAILYMFLLCIGYDLLFLRHILENGQEWLSELSEATATMPGTLQGIWIDGIVPILVIAGTVSLFLWFGKRNKWLFAGSLTAFSFAVVVIILKPVESPSDGFIIQQRAYTDCLRVYDKGIAEMKEIKAGTEGLWIINGVKTGHSSGDASRLKNCAYLLICKGFNGDLEYLKQRNPDMTIVLMPSLNGYERERKAQECAELGIRCHDIRTDGPLRVLKQQEKEGV